MEFLKQSTKATNQCAI